MKYADTERVRSGETRFVRTSTHCRGRSVSAIALGRRRYSAFDLVPTLAITPSEIKGPTWDAHRPSSAAVAGVVIARVIPIDKRHQFEHVAWCYLQASLVVLHERLKEQAWVGH